MLIYMNGESLQKSIEKMFKKKIIEGCIQKAMFDQCICGHKELAQVTQKSILTQSTISLLYFETILIVSWFTRTIFHHLFLYLNTCWLAKKKKPGSLASMCILVCLKNSMTLIQDKKFVA